MFKNVLTGQLQQSTISQHNEVQAATTEADYMLLAISYYGSMFYYVGSYMFMNGLTENV